MPNALASRVTRSVAVHCPRLGIGCSNPDSVASCLQKSDSSRATLSEISLSNWCQRGTIQPRKCETWDASSRY
jgi:hypothetical protein